MRGRILPSVLAVGMVLFSSGCAVFGKRGRVPSPPPVTAPAPQPKLPEPVKQEPKLPEPPAIEFPKPEPPQLEQPAPKAPEPPKPKPRRKTVSRPVAPAPSTQPETKPEPPAQPATPAPRLGEVLSENERKDLLAQFEVNITEARRVLTALPERSLTREQSDRAARVRAFIDQALGMRDSDISTAVELSRRALLLARDLAESVK